MGVAWLMREDGRGYARRRRRRRFAARNLCVVAEGLGGAAAGSGSAGVRTSLGKGRQRMKAAEIAGLASLLPQRETSWARHSMARKYWLLGIAFWMEPARGLVEVAPDLMLKRGTVLAALRERLRG